MPTYGVCNWCGKVKPISFVGGHNKISDRGHWQCADCIKSNSIEVVTQFD